MANNLSANDFQLGVQVVPKTDQLNSEFKKISQTATLNVNVKINDQSFKKVNKVVETYSNNLINYQKAIKLNAESVIPIIIAVTKRPIPIRRTPQPDILQKSFLLLGDTLS